MIAHDPVALDNAKRVISSHKYLKFISDWETELSSIDAIVIATKWGEYKKLSSSVYQDVLVGKILLDARRLFKPTDFPQLDYLTIGRIV